MSLKDLFFMDKKNTHIDHKVEGKMRHEDSLVKKFEGDTNTNNSFKVAIVFIAMIVFGIGSGFLIAKGTGGGTSASTGTQVESKEEIVVGKVYGSDDMETFSDVAEGKLKEGGIEGEGQYHLERAGGESKYVYITSSVVDLGLLEGREIKVWGQTQKAQYAPWLMDVGRVEVLK